MEKTRTSNGIMWSCLSFSIFMIIHLFSIRITRWSSTIYGIIVELALVLVSLAFFIFVKKFGNEGSAFFDFMSFKTTSITNIIFSTISILLIVPFSSLLALINSIIVSFIIPNPLPMPDTAQYMLDYNFLSAIIIFAVLPAICEEIFFRGFVLGATKGYGKMTAVLLNGFLFALAHVSLYRVLDTFVLGVIFAYVALKTNSIIPSIIMHFVNNASRVALLFFINNLYELDILELTETQATEEIMLGELTLEYIMGAALGFLIFITLSILIFLGALMIIKRMHNTENHKRWLYGYPPIEEMPAGEDTMAKGFQLLFVIPAVLCFIILALSNVVIIPVIEDIIRFILGI